MHGQATVTSMNIVLYQPEIAPNVGSIIRTCAGFGASLTLVHPLGFIWDEHRLRRYKLDYNTVINHVDVDFVDANLHNLVAISVYGEQNYREYCPNMNDIFIFGRESTGLPKLNYKTSLRIPTNIRSLNLGVSVGIILAHFHPMFNMQAI